MYRAIGPAAKIAISIGNRPFPTDHVLPVTKSKDRFTAF